MQTAMRLLRVEQWYKNLVIFLPILFSLQFTNTGLLLQAIIGFLGLCLISSANYIINDIKDRKKDRMHPEKKTRPIAAGKVSPGTGFVIALIAAIAGFFLGYKVSFAFMAFQAGLLLLTTAYTLFLKKEPFVDMLVIAINFTQRTVSGAFLTTTANTITPTIPISPWLILCPFFLALFLALGKKYAEFLLLKKKAVQHKENNRFYNISNLESYMTIATTLLVISYSFYSFQRDSKLLITLPFALYSIFRYYYFIHARPEIARNPHKIIKDIRIIIAGLLWAATIILALTF